MTFRPIVFLLLAAPGALRAAEPLADAAPLVVVTGAVAPGEGLLKLNAARSALEMGQPSVAAGLFEQMLAAPETPGTDRNALVLDLVSARLNQGDTAAAAKALQGYTGRTTAAAYQLRAGLIAARTKRFADARAAVAAVRPEELAADERGWFYFLQGAVADADTDSGHFERARAAYQQAADAAGSDLQRAQFRLARERAQLNAGEVTQAQADALLRTVLLFPGQTPGYDAARQLAVVLAALASHGAAEAVAFLQKQLQGVPAADRATRDKFRWLIGLIAGAGEPAGKAALEELLTDADDRDLQRAALQLLARGSAADKTRNELAKLRPEELAAREQFRAKLDALIGGPTQHPILEDLLLFRAQLALDDLTPDYDKAELDAKDMLKRFPGSKLKPAALNVLTGVAWERGFYRQAADWAAQARAALPPGDWRAGLGVLVAEAYFRAGDWQNAAAAYAAALAESPAGVAPGALIFQQVLAAIKTGGLDAAGKLLDGFAGDARLDAVNRWQAEWNLARELQATGADGVRLAYGRVNRLVGDAAGASELPPGLRVQMAWLQTRLALEAGEAEQTLSLGQTLLDALPGTPGLEARQSDGATLRDEVTASTRLLQARANFRLKRPEAALALLQALRTDDKTKTTDAAVYSYIDEADYQAGMSNNFVEAQKLLTELADKFPRHAYAPYALYRAALNAEHRGADLYYEEAIRILERLLTVYPKSDLDFYARLKQGDLWRRMNDFADAQRTYEFLVNNFPTHADVLSAWLALAASHRAQAAPGDSHYESALRIFERLQDLPLKPGEPADLRVEAGFHHGDMLAQRADQLAQQGRPEEEARAARAQAAAVWWSLVTVFLLDDAQAARLGATGRTWMARTLIHHGDLLAKAGQLEEAGNSYRLLLQKGLPLAQLAQQSLDRVAAKPAGGATQ